MGDTTNYEHRGIAPRSLNQLFSEVNSRIEFEFRVSCTYMEIYNERIFDLLQDLSNPDVATDYTIAEDKSFTHNSAGVVRTARKLAAGEVFIPSDILSA